MRKIRFLLSLVIIIVVSFSASFFVSTKVYNDYWYDMMTKVEDLLKDDRLDLIEEDKINKDKADNIFHDLNNQVWLLAQGNDFKSSDILNNIYYDNDFVGYAVVVTNDGWLMTSNNVKSIPNLVLINNQDEIIEIEEMVSDPLLDITYLKTNQSNLESIAIADSNVLEVSEMVYAIKPNLYNYQNEVLLNSIRNMHSRFISRKQDLVHNPEDIVIYGLLNLEIDEHLPLVNKQSQFIGFSRNFNQNTYLLPSKYIRYSLARLFNNEEGIIYPSLGVAYIDLTEVVLSEDLPQHGVFIYQVLDNKNLQKGDIIIAVGNEEINEVRSLNTLLLDYKIGQEINLKLIRQGKEMEVNVIIKPLF